MKLKISLCLLVFVIAVPYLWAADTDDIEKQTILANRFAQFKQESGFRGVYKSDASQTRIQQIVGNFQDTAFTAEMDDAQLALLSEDILRRVKPIIQVQGNLILADVVKRFPGLLRVFYQQVVNGYQVKSGVYVRIDFYPGRKYFDLYNDTWGFDITPVDTVLTRDQAIAIYRELQQKHEPKLSDAAEPQTDLAYYLIDWGSNMGIQLSWMISGAHNACLINAVTGKVRMYYGYQMKKTPPRHIWGLLSDWQW
jgi:hypothetical protein